ncbi:MAG: hypothetical protein L0Y72_00030, partial [Gemmataceae bacterium]|nr:hypothetical protein [Gemmataceae bacterium]MCI0737397.1 hypothetical protein [Gemmataceae bacterium]
MRRETRDDPPCQSEAFAKNTRVSQASACVYQDEPRESPTGMSPGLEAILGAGMVAALKQEQDPFAAAPAYDYLESEQLRIATAPPNANANKETEQFVSAPANLRPQ